MTRKVTIDLNDLLSLVGCAEDYGHGNSSFFATMGEWSGPVSDEEIEAFAQTFLEPEAIKQGYGEEDAAVARERLTEWRDRYARVETAKTDEGSMDK